jgi:hypothetical protein
VSDEFGDKANTVQRSAVIDRASDLGKALHFGFSLRAAEIRYKVLHEWIIAK